MISDVLTKVIEELQEICLKQKVKVAFMGGMAVSAYGFPRATYDIDAVMFIEEKKLNLFLSELHKRGFSYDKKNPVKIIQGKPFITLTYLKSKVYIDLFLARDEFSKQVLLRTRKFKLNRMKINLVSPEDLILIKLQAGRERDLDDVRAILSENVSKLDFNYLRNQARKLRVDLYLKDELESLGLSMGF
jgi:predicted nucleotidyltransferase